MKLPTFVGCELFVNASWHMFNQSVSYVVQTSCSYDIDFSENIQPITCWVAWMECKQYDWNLQHNEMAKVSNLFSMREMTSLPYTANTRRWALISDNVGNYTVDLSVTMTHNI